MLLELPMPRQHTKEISRAQSRQNALVNETNLNILFFKCFKRMSKLTPFASKTKHLRSLHENCTQGPVISKDLRPVINSQNTQYLKPKEAP